MRFAIKKIPNDPAIREAVKAALPESFHITSWRGRGFRRGLRHFHQSLPMEFAAYCTLYCHEDGDIRDTHWGSKYVHCCPVEQATFRGFRDGKPVIRLERRGHVATPYQLS